MNCNTTHYRANSSSVPGDPTGEVARLEVETSELVRLLETSTREIIDREFKKIGFRFVAVDLRGFRSGSLNEGIVNKTA